MNVTGQLEWIVENHKPKSKKKKYKFKSNLKGIKFEPNLIVVIIN
jgi:hypothetical protein